MKIKIGKSEFLNALKKVQPIVPGKGALQVIQNVLMEMAGNKLTLTATDMDTTIRTTIDCEGDDGTTTLPMDKLFGAVQLAPDGAIIEIDVAENDRAILKTGKTQFKLSGLPAADFPPLPAGEEKTPFTIDQTVLREMLRRTSYAASKDETRKSLRGVFVSFKEQKLTMVATDGRRLALIEHEIEFPASEERDFILPNKLVADLGRMLNTDDPIAMGVINTQVVFHIGSTTLYAKLLDDVYPNFRQVIPHDMTGSVKVNTAELLAAVENAKIINKDPINAAIRLSFNTNQLVISSLTNDGNESRSEIEVKYEADPFEMCFNPNFITEPLKTVDDDEITFEIKTVNSPVIIRCSIPFLYVMMPLRAN